MSQFILRKGTARLGILASLTKFLADLSPDTEWSVKVEKHKKDRTESQNNALWAVAYPAIERESGNDPEDLHTYFCGEFFGWRETLVMGKKKVKPRRTTTRDENGKRDVIPWDQFCDFYNMIQRRSAEIGIYVPDPDPNYREAMSRRAA
jgi:hypothetical protein